jgi:hypothetical protein
LISSSDSVGTVETDLYFRNGEDTTWGSLRRIWDSGNDGSGSGLNADLLDGNHAAAFLRSNVDAIMDAGTNTTLTIKSNDNGRSRIALYGDNQGTGQIYVGQSSAYGGGIEYNGDGSPSTTGGGSDNIVLYRVANNDWQWTARNYYSNNHWTFRGNIYMNTSDLVATQAWVGSQGFLGSAHSSNPSAHHTRYADSEAILAVENETTLDLTGLLTILGQDFSIIKQNGPSSVSAVQSTDGYMSPDTYTVAVVAVKNGTYTDYTGHTDTVILSAPNDEVYVTWSAVTGATGYRIFIKGTPGGVGDTWKYYNVSGGSTTQYYIDDYPTSGTTGNPPTTTDFYMAKIKTLAGTSNRTVKVDTTGVLYAE